MEASRPGNFTGWTVGGNFGATIWGPQTSVDGHAESGQFAANIGAMGSDATLSQTLQTTAGQQYTLTFWLANSGGGPNDFTAKWNGTTLLPLVNAPAQGYTQYSYTVTATGSASTLEFDGRQDPAWWDLDNISVIATGTQVPSAPPVITSLGELPSSGALNAGKTLTLTLNFNEVVTVAGGTPTLSLNDGGTATYTGGSGSSALTFSNTVLAGQNTPDLIVTAVNLNAASITDSVGNAANVSLSGVAQGSPSIDTIAPANPVISNNSVSSSNVVTLNGTAEANSNVTVFDGTTQLGTATANASGAWSYSTAALPSGSHSFTATDMDAAGNTSVASSPLNLTLSTPVTPVNLVSNGSFETGNFTGWTVGGNFGATIWGPQTSVDGHAESGQFAANIGAMGSDATLSQTLQTTAGQQYTLTFWLANSGGGPNDFTAKWNGTTLLPLVNAPAQGYTQYSYTVTATGSTSTLEFDGRQDPAWWDLDNISVIATGTQAPSAPTIASFSPDSGVVGDHITDVSTLTLTGSAVANGTVNVYDGTTLLGTATANSSGAWSFATAALTNGTHSFSATDTVSGTTSAASNTLSVKVDTHVPAVTQSLANDTGISSTDKITSNDMLTGTGDVNAVVHFTVDGIAVVGTATANPSGVWAFTPTGLADGSHTIVASETDVAGTTGTASLTFTLDTTALAPTITLFSPDSGGRAMVSPTRQF